MEQPDYHQHELQYQYLREKGFSGWGGENFDRRMQGWKGTVESLVASSEFPIKGSKILEIGAGAGDSLIPFAESGYDITGIDVSPTAIEWAREKFTARSFRGQFKVANLAVLLPFENNVFDAVIDAACLHCLIAEDRAIALKEISRVLKPGSFFLVSHMVNDPRELGAAFSFDTASRTQLQNGVPYRTMPTFEGLKSELTSSGFKVIKETVRPNTWWDHAEIWCRKNDVEVSI